MRSMTTKCMSWIPGGVDKLSLKAAYDDETGYVKGTACHRRGTQLYDD